MHALDARGKYVLVAALAALASLGTAHAGDTVLYAFTGGNDGANPAAGLIENSAGNLYGTAYQGGAPCSSPGCGTIFKLAPDGTETVVYAFTGGSDGEFPRAGLIQDKAGNLYGTASSGGTYNCGCGTVFKLALDGTYTVLYSFVGGSDGEYPQAGLIQDKAGNFYGTTAGGGAPGGGTVFKLAPDGTETVLHSFAGGSDGAYPFASLVRDKAGNLYGTTSQGGDGCPPYGCGIVFKVAPDGTETVLHTFAGGSDGAYPLAGLTKDDAGNLYGTTQEGGGTGTGCDQNIGCGTIFKLASDGTYSVLHAFTGGSDGGLPETVLIEDNAGNLYGTTDAGGGTGCILGFGCGTVFKFASDGTETVLYAFHGGRKDGSSPQAGLFKDGTGKLYGTTAKGGGTGCYGNYGCGTVFALKK